LDEEKGVVHSTDTFHLPEVERCRGHIAGGKSGDRDEIG